MDLIIELSKGMVMIGIGISGIVLCIVLLAVTEHIFHRKKKQLLDEIKMGE